MGRTLPPFVPRKSARLGAKIRRLPWALGRDVTSVIIKHLYASPKDLANFRATNWGLSQAISRDMLVSAYEDFNWPLVQRCFVCNVPGIQLYTTARMFEFWLDKNPEQLATMATILQFSILSKIQCKSIAHRCRIANGDRIMCIRSVRCYACMNTLMQSML